MEKRRSEQLQQQLHLCSDWQGTSTKWLLCLSIKEWGFSPLGRLWQQLPQRKGHWEPSKVPWRLHENWVGSLCGLLSPLLPVQWVCLPPFSFPSHSAVPSPSKCVSVKGLVCQKRTQNLPGMCALFSFSNRIAFLLFRSWWASSQQGRERHYASVAR